MARSPAVRLGEDIWRLRLLGDFVNGYALRDPDGQVTLVDTGLSRSAPAVARALRAIRVAPQQVTRVLVSHVHYDHVGALAEVVRRTGAAVSVHEADAGFLAAGHGPPRDPSSLLARLMGRFTDETSQEFEPVGTEHRLADGDVLDVAGGLRVLHTPGHSPGHVSFLHEPSRTLITGDALFHPAGWLRWSLKPFCTDFRLSQQTAQRFAELDYGTAAFMHGPQIASRAKQRVDAFLATWDGLGADGPAGQRAR